MMRRKGLIFMLVLLVLAGMFGHLAVSVERVRGVEPSIHQSEAGF